jgi:hypothetical protein
MRKKPANWIKPASIAGSARETARKLMTGQTPGKAELQRLPDYVVEELKNIKPERSRYPSSRLDQPKPDRDRRQRSLLHLTHQERRRLLAAKPGAEVDDGLAVNQRRKLTRRLTHLHVRIAHTLARWPDGQPSHEQLAQAAGTSARTLRRALSALRKLGLLPGGRRGLVRTEVPKHAHGFQRIMAAIADHAGCSVPTLYRWEQDLRALRGKPRRMTWRPKGDHTRRMQTD